jgi:hypothetical protein
MRSRSIRTATLVIPTVLLALAGCVSNDAAATTPPTSSPPKTDAVGPTYRGAAGIAGAAAGDYEPAFDSSGYIGAVGVVGVAAGTFK